MSVFVFTFVCISVTFGSKQLFSPGCVVLCGAVFYLRQRQRCSVQYLSDHVARSFTDTSISKDAIATDYAHCGESPGCGIDFESWG